MRRVWSAVSHQRNRFVPSKHKIQAIVCCLCWWASEITLLLLSQEIHLFSQETHLPETICVYQFGPGVTQQKADAWCGQFKGGQNSTCWQPQWHQIVVLSRSHHCTSRTLSLIHKFFLSLITHQLWAHLNKIAKLKGLTISVPLGRTARLGLVLLPRRCSRHGWCVTSWKVIRTQNF